MTNRQAISAEIEPYGLSDDSLEKAFIDACDHFGTEAQIDGEYSASVKQSVLVAAMYCLNRLRVLVSENIGGISQNFDVKKLEKRIAALASQAGVSSDMVLADSDSASITYMPIW